MTLHDLNMLPKVQLRQELLKCCGSSAWVEKVMNFFPIEDLVELLDDAEEEWYKCSQEDWKEAFSHHPMIGDIDSLKKKFASTANWAMGEQSGTSSASEETIKALVKGNKEYQYKFGYIFIVCATGKSADEMLTLLESRLLNDPEKEIEIAADEQNKITRLRLQKLLDK
jgi:2-oxo-4-hydroxy-4-carboxy-5-ureidoimidazoline decarboxylase